MDEHKIIGEELIQMGCIKIERDVPISPKRHSVQEDPWRVGMVELLGRMEIGESICVVESRKGQPKGGYIRRAQAVVQFMRNRRTKNGGRKYFTTRVIRKPDNYFAIRIWRTAERQRPRNLEEYRQRRIPS